MQKKVAEMEEEAAECSSLWDPGRKKGENTRSIIWKYGSYEKCASRGRKKDTGTVGNANARSGLHCMVIRPIFTQRTSAPTPETPGL